MKTQQKVIAWAGAALLVAAGTISGVAIANPAGSESAPAKIVQEEPKTVDLEPEVTPEPTQEPVAPAPAPEPAPEPEPVAPPPPAPQPAPAPSGAASGTPLPFYASSDPNNAQGGEYADPGSFCASKSGSTVGGVPVCD